MALQGLPLTTDPPGSLQGNDTVIERLDDASFDDQGIARTRIRFRALSLVSIAPIKTACGAFHVYVSLGGKQKVTTMTIRRTQENGGYFSAPLAIDAKMTFIPVKPARNKSARKLEMLGRVTFPAARHPWTLTPSPVKRISTVSVDTNGDLKPETPLPGTSNFLAGQSPDHPTYRFMASGACSCCAEPICHANNGEEHCTYPTMCPGTMSCC